MSPPQAAQVDGKQGLWTVLNCSSLPLLLSRTFFLFLCRSIPQAAVLHEMPQCGSSSSSAEESLLWHLENLLPSLCSHLGGLFLTALCQEVIYPFWHTLSQRQHHLAAGTQLHPAMSSWERTGYLAMWTTQAIACFSCGLQVWLSDKNSTRWVRGMCDHRQDHSLVLELCCVPPETDETHFL